MKRGDAYGFMVRQETVQVWTQIHGEYLGKIDRFCDDCSPFRALVRVEECVSPPEKGFRQYAPGELIQAGATSIRPRFCKTRGCIYGFNHGGACAFAEGDPFGNVVEGGNNR
jgi:hypothetical protein